MLSYLIEIEFLRTVVRFKFYFMTIIAELYYCYYLLILAIWYTDFSYESSYFTKICTCNYKKLRRFIISASAKLRAGFRIHPLTVQNLGLVFSILPLQLLPTKDFHRCTFVFAASSHLFRRKRFSFVLFIFPIRIFCGVLLLNILKTSHWQLLRFTKLSTVGSFKRQYFFCSDNFSFLDIDLRTFLSNIFRYSSAL